MAIARCHSSGSADSPCTRATRKARGTAFMQHLHSSGAAIPFGINGFRFAAKRFRLWGDLGLLRSDATCELAGFADLMTR
jgi:hypothetical protein